MSNEALKELGKSFMSFANLFTVLSFVNIYFKQEQTNIFAIILTVYMYIAFHVMGYMLIKTGESDA